MASVAALHCRHHDVRLDDLKHVCALGIDIRAHVGGPSLGWMRRTPCFLPNAKEPGHVPCAKCEPHSAAEIEERERETENAVQRILQQSELILQVKERGKGGTFKCSACGGQLTIRIAPNGHTAGACSTEGCARWIE